MFFQYQEQLLFLNLAFSLWCVQGCKVFAWQQQSVSLFLDPTSAVMHPAEISVTVPYSRERFALGLAATMSVLLSFPPLPFGLQRARMAMSRSTGEESVLAEVILSNFGDNRAHFLLSFPPSSQVSAPQSWCNPTHLSLCQLSQLITC